MDTNTYRNHLFPPQIPSPVTLIHLQEAVFLPFHWGGFCFLETQTCPDHQAVVSPTILHHLSPVAGATGAGRAISSIKKNTNALPGIFTRSHITWITRCSYLFFGLRAWQGFYKSHLFPSDTKNDPSVCDTKIELGIKFGNSDTEIQVTATQAKRELKSILGVDSLSLEGTFMHTGYVVQSKGEEITQSKEHKDSCHMGVTLRLARETMTPTSVFMASRTKALQTDQGSHCTLLA